MSVKTFHSHATHRLDSAHEATNDAGLKASLKTLLSAHHAGLAAAEGEDLNAQADAGATVLKAAAGVVEAASALPLGDPAHDKVVLALYAVHDTMDAVMSANRARMHAFFGH